MIGIFSQMVIFDMTKLNIRIVSLKVVARGLDVFAISILGLTPGFMPSPSPQAGESTM